MNFFVKKSMTVCLAACIISGASVYAQDPADRVARTLEEAVKPVMNTYEIMGMTVAITLDGTQSYYNYGVASKESGQKVSEHTLFEIGSISKTFTATLAAYAQAQHTLQLTDPASKYLSALAGSAFDRITLLDLATYSAGGLPLQFPDEITIESLQSYYQSWQPEYPAGTHRLYSNPSIGLLGYLTAQSMGETFDALIETKLLPMLGLTETYIKVPENQLSHYAYGYSKEGKPIRVNPGVLDAEAYGIKTTAADLLRYLEANMHMHSLDKVLQQAIEITHTGYYTVGQMMQGLGWEMYPYPVSLDQLLEGNSSEMILNAHPIQKQTTPAVQNAGVLFNKTGSTNGFGAYVVFIPEKKFGLVILANKHYPNAERVKLAYQIMNTLFQ